MDLKISALLFLCLLKSGFGQRYSPWRIGRCLNPITLPNVNPLQFFSDRWYLLKSYGNFLYQGTGICPGFVSRITDDGQILIKTYNYNRRLNSYLSLDGKANLNELWNGRGSLTVTFLGLGFIPVEVPFSILGTDNKDWAIIYSCKQRLLFKSEMVFVLVRDRGSTDNNPEVHQTILSARLNLNDFVPSINTGCGANEPNV